MQATFSTPGPNHARPQAFNRCIKTGPTLTSAEEEVTEDAIKEAVDAAAVTSLYLRSVLAICTYVNDKLSCST